MALDVEKIIDVDDSGPIPVTVMNLGEAVLLDWTDDKRLYGLSDGTLLLVAGLRTSGELLRTPQRDVVVVTRPLSRETKKGMDNLLDKEFIQRELKMAVFEMDGRRSHFCFDEERRQWWLGGS